MSIIFLGLAALTLSACTPTSSGGHPEVVSNVVEYANATCLFGAQDGDRAINSLAMTKNIARAAFGKEFNISRLLGVGTASVDETIRYIGDLGVNVYKVPSDGIGCSLLKAALEMPSGLLPFWKRFEESSAEGSKDRAAKEKARLLGLYIGATTTLMTESKESRPFILIRENSTRWTLVHEFMHHLFMERAIEHGYNDKVMIGRTTKAIEALAQGSDEQLKTISGLKELSKAVLLFVQSNDEFMLHYALEEMAVEDQLRRLYEAGRLKFVTAYSYDQAGWYIAYSANTFGKVKRESESFIGIFRQAVGERDMSMSSRLEILRDLNSAQQILNDREGQIREIKSRNSRRELSTGAIGAQGNEANTFRPCAHSEFELQVLKKLKAINKKFHK